MEHDNEQYTDNAGNAILQQQYNQNYNPSDAFSSHAYGHSDASWNVNATAFPQTSKLSHVSYQNGDWPMQQDAQSQRDSFTHSPLPGGAVYNGHGNYNGYDDSTFAYPAPPQQYDPSLMPAQNSAFRQIQPVSQHVHDARTIEPHALDNTQQRSQSQPSQPPAAPTVSAAARLTALHKDVPKGSVTGDFSIINSDKLAKATNSERLAAFLFIGKEPIAWDLNRSALPAYTPRASKNDLKRAAGEDGQLLAKINSRSFKKQRIAKARSSRPMKSASDVAASRADVSSESDYSSDYSSDADDEVSPLPAKRPEMPKEAMEYDTIQALWKSRRANVTAADIRKGLVDFWELVKTVRDRWKLDGQAVTTAEGKGAKGELPMLRQRVKDSRDMIEVAFKAALQHGNRTIVSNFSENTALLFLCYQFLLDRFKSEDVNGPLAKTLLEVLSLATSITTEKLDKTYLGKVLPRFTKLGDAKTQHLAKTIANKATPGKAEPAKVERPIDKAVAPAGNKRAAESDAGIAPKRPANASTTAAVSKPAAAVVKKAVPNGAAAKTTPADIVKPAPKPSTLKSGLFAGLQSAAKKPGTSLKTGTPAAAVATKPAVVPVKPQAAPQAAAAPKPAFSFADTMRSLTQPKEDKPKPKTIEKETANETPEQKARRLRREARGPLRVHWKSADELVAIREFTHDPEEETGHDSSQTRDVADLKGEGRMFKQQHNKMELDEDDDEVDDPLREWYEPKEVDFSDVPDEERQRNFYPYGGAQQKAESAENVERKKYEDSTLSVFYSHADDIPLTPRDPEEPISGEQSEVKQFGALSQEYVDRGAKLRASRQPAVPAPAPIDFSALRNIMGMQPNAFAAPAPAPPHAPAGVPDIGAIIAQLQQNKPQAQAPPPFMPQFAGLFPQPPVAAAPPPAGTPDIAAILAQINGGQAPAPPPVQAPALPFAMPPPPGMADPGFLAFLAQRAAQAQSPAPSNGGIYENADRKRMRDA